MATRTQSGRKHSQGKLNLSAISLVASIVLPLLSLGYTVWHDRQVAKESKKNVEDFNGRIASITASLRILTQTVAPQIYGSIRDNLSTAKATPTSSSGPHFGAAASSLEALAAQSVKPDQNQLQEIGQTLLNLEPSHAEVNTYWTASSKLVSYKTSEFRSKTSEENCLSSGHVAPEVLKLHDGPVQPAIDSIVLSDCTLALDDTNAFQNSLDGKLIQWGLKSIGPNTLLQLHLRNVHVIYRGGKIIPQIWSIIFDHCFIDLDYSAPPSGRGREITTQLLAANPDLPVQVQFSAAT